jgi:hypothetical protein
MFDQQVMKAEMGAVLTENARNMNSCDPCAADPLSHEELFSLGVFWFNETPPDLIPGRGHRSIVPTMGGARDVFVARMLQETADCNNLQPWRRQENEARQLADLTGWKLADIRQQITHRTADAGDDAKRWQNLRTS